MATYNGERYIEQQIASILPQLGRSDELIISDDGSSDGTLEIVQRIQGSNDNVHLISGPGLGVVENFQNALAAARGDVIFLSDQDDIWAQNKVDKVLEVMSDNSANLVVHNAELFGDIDNTDIPTIFKWRQSRPGVLKNLVKNSFVGCCMAFDRKVLDISMPFPKGLPMHDWWIGLLASGKTKVVFIDDCLIKYRRHGDNVSDMNHKPIVSMLCDRVRLCFCIILRTLRNAAKGF